MWILKEVHASNLCAFKQMGYSLLQGHTTLIFGNNMDNDSQRSNGSGKSAMLEAIAIGLTGEPLRKIKMDEIINDAENEAVVRVVLVNDSENKQMTVSRRLSRKSPQEILVSMQTGAHDTDVEEISQASVADYNKYVLDTLGLTKDDIFSNYILSKHKYTSFLSSSDREKKEIINRFSNGVIVDESIAALQADMQPIEEALREAENGVATCNGRVDALTEQINNALNEQTERSQKKAERLKAWQDAITEKRAYIRQQREAAQDADEILAVYDEIDETWRKAEESKKGVAECYETISCLCRINELKQPQDYATQSVKNQERLAELEKQYKDIQAQVKQHDKKTEAAKTAYTKFSEKYEKFKDGYGKKAEKIEQQINRLLEDIRTLEKDNDGLRKQRVRLQDDIAALQKQLAGVIVCPKCKHEFVMAENVDIEDVRRKIQDRQGEATDIADNIAKNQQDIESYTAKGREVRKEQNELADSKAEWSEKLTESKTDVDKMIRESSKLQSDMQAVQWQMAQLEKAISNSRANLFDEAFEILDEAIKTQNNAIKTADVNIKNAEGAIESYEESIRDIDKSSETDMIEKLKDSKKKYEQELDAAIAKKEEVEQKLNSYKVQEATFVEFKTHLANTKIDALSHITNEFLEAIGSDIRIAFSGFTVLKSGKVRDKISISLIRDGVDCGSFDKFSEGEKARVNLANILAMHKLTNVNCDEGKGLDLLVLDEILEATDEQGLSNIFDALNQLQITALVVSHGNIAEGYPYKTVVNKLNGVSYIND